MFYYDWTILLIIPGLLLGLWAQYSVTSAYNKYSRVRVRSGVTADQAARDMLSRSGNGQVDVRPIAGQMTDRFDPRTNALSLSSGVYGSDSVAALGIAAHETGHALQQGAGYFPMKLRTAIVPVVNIGSTLYFPIFVAGLIFSFRPLVTAGIICFALSVGFSLITLPVEINASRRAVQLLETGGYVAQDEMPGVKKVLTAAAMTYVAAAVSSLLQLLRLLIISRRRD